MLVVKVLESREMSDCPWEDGSGSAAAWRSGFLGHPNLHEYLWYQWMWDDARRAICWDLGLQLLKGMVWPATSSHFQHFHPRKWLRVKHGLAKRSFASGRERTLPGDMLQTCSMRNRFGFKIISMC